MIRACRAGGRVPVVVPVRVRIESLEAGGSALSAAPDPAETGLVVPVSTAVPTWLGALVEAASAAGAAVFVEAEPPADLEGEALDGWEIGLCTAALAAGAAGVLGIDPQRVRRVREVDGALAAHAPGASPEPAA